MIVINPIHGIASLSTSTMINWEGTRILLDTGPGTITEIWRRGLHLKRLSGILLSHRHLDHAWGLAPLLWFMKNRDWKRSVKLIFPENMEPIVRQLILIAGEPSFVSLFPLSQKSSTQQIEKLIIHSFMVNHPVPSIGFILTETAKPRLNTTQLESNGIPKSSWGKLAQNQSITHQGRQIQPQQYMLKPRPRKIVYTGDTGPTPNLVQNAKDADLLIVDATWVYPQWDPPEEAPHLTLHQVIELAHEARVQRVLLTHLTTRLSLKKYHQTILELQKDRQSEIPIHLPDQEQIEIY